MLSKIPGSLNFTVELIIRKTATCNVKCGFHFYGLFMGNFMTFALLQN